jgi:hypothetical protein
VVARAEENWAGDSTGWATGTAKEIDGTGSDSMASLRKLSPDMSEEAVGI